jgi:hypothetical protein
VRENVKKTNTREKNSNWRGCVLLADQLHEKHIVPAHEGVYIKQLRRNESSLLSK